MLPRLLLAVVGVLLVACAAKPPVGAGQIAVAPAASQSELPFQPRLQLADAPAAGWRTLALPATWNQAVFSFVSATALPGTRLWTVPKTAFTYNSAATPPNYQFTGTQATTPKFPPFKPASDYTIVAHVETTGASFDTLEAYDALVNQAIISGGNTKVFNLTTTGVSTALAIGGGATADTAPEIACTTGGGRYLSVWMRDNNIIARANRSDGTVIEARALVANGTSARPAVAYNAFDNVFVVVWEDTRNGSRDIMGRAVRVTDLAINDVTTNFDICTQAAMQVAPAIASHTLNARLLVTWQDLRNGTDYGIYSSVINTNGAIINNANNSAVTVLANTPREERQPRVVFSETSNRFFISYEDYAADGTIDLRYRTVCPCDGLIDQAGTVSAAAGSQWSASLAYNLHDNDILVAWTDNRSGNADIYYRIYDFATNTFQLVETPLINTGTAEAWPAAGYFVKSGGSSYVVAFADFRNGADYNIYYRRIKRDGTTLWGEKLLSGAAAEQRFPAVAAGNAGGEAMAIWEDDRSLATNSTDIYGAQFF